VLTGSATDVQKVVQGFIRAMGQHRHWERAVAEQVSA
jgi:hypothetical protein